MNEMSVDKKDEFVLYYFPTSFSSQKVMFAFYEKDIPFKAKLVSLFSGQHNEPWYVKLNPDGNHIPVLKHGDKIIVEPSKIINHVSSVAEGSGGHPLVPSLNSELGKNVRELREKLDGIQVDILTYGIIYHPHLSPAGCLISGAEQRSMKENFAKRLSILTELATKHPDLRDGYLAKSQTAANSFDSISDESQVRSHLEDLGALFTTIEDQLKKIREVGSDISDELWLFGPMFTAADISLSVLLNRLSILGLDRRYFPIDKCPCICQYYMQVKKRSAFIKIETQVSNLRMTLIWENFKTIAPYLAGGVGLGVLVGVGYYTYRKVNS